MHGEARRYVQRLLARVTLPEGPVLEIGSRNVNGVIRHLFPNRPYTGIDIVPARGVDVVASGAAYQPVDPPAVVICMEVLEHTPEAEAICRNARRVLARGGVFIVTAAGEGRAPHAANTGKALRDGEYYRNVSRHDLAQWLSVFPVSEIEVNEKASDIYAYAVAA